MNENNITTQLRDIKPLLEIPDSSYALYWGLILFVSLFVLGLVLFLGIKLWKNRKINLEKGYLEAIKQIDWLDSKKSAYEATHYARLLANDEQRKELFTQLLPMLEQYKYKKEVQNIDEETKKLFKLYVQVADESI
jgi:hypothetical protein